MERRKFEDSFQEAFKDAEVNPSENVWTNIELDLEKAEGDKMKRRLFFFQTVAAASVIFAMTVAGIGYYVMQNDNAGGLVQKSVGTNPTSGQESIDNRTEALAAQGDNKNSTEGERAIENGIAAESNAGNKTSDSKINESQSSIAKSEGDDNSLSKATNKTAGSTHPTVNEKKVDSNSKNSGDVPRKEKSIGKKATPFIAAEIPGTSDVTQKNTSVLSSEKVANDNATTTVSSPSALPQKDNALTQPAVASNVNRKLPALYQPNEPELQLPASSADPGMLLLARLADEEKRYAKEEKDQKKNKAEKLWTGVGFAAGAFNANNPTVEPVPSNAMYSMNSANTAAKQSKASGVSYSVGVSVGTQLSKRWVLHGGINYLTQTSDYTANSVVVVNNNFESPKAASINAFAPQLADATADTKVAQTFPYSVNNNVRFMSVPVQAGYLVVNRKFGLQLNAGVSTDLFLQNTITPDGGGITSTTQGRGDESPYRPLNFSGLMGTEFSYKLGYRYRLSLNPALRYPFSSVYKSTTGVNSTPLTFDIGLRFRYIFH